MEIVTKIATIALALIMLGLGLGLTTQDFLRVLKQPKDFFIGFVCQLILLPIIAFLLIKILNTPLELALGVMIIAAAPGGVTSNVLTKFANGTSFMIKVGLMSLIVNVVMMTGGCYVAKSFASGMDQRKCISLESGLQNGTLAVFVSTQIFDNIVYMVPTSAYALIMVVTSIIFVFLVKNLD